MPRTQKTAKKVTTAQRLDGIVKSARKIMRKDKGLNGDLDRLPILTWVMFLKFLDDKERIEEKRDALSNKKHKPAIKAPYRWRDWASPKTGFTGPDLLQFISSESARLPDGNKGPGLFVYLRSLRGADGERDRRDVIANVFRGLSNRMESGYLLREVVNLIDGIHFDSTEEMNTLGRMYETLLREMRDAAGDSGEFYTPRPVVKFMVDRVGPTLGETILDPACGTGGFLAEAFEHVGASVRTVKQRSTLQTTTISGGEAKPLPFLLGQMNLLLHGLEAPNITYGNALGQRLNDITNAQRVDIILTNPPFGGEEERGILGNFPSEMQTAETALLFLQLLMKRLKKTPKARAAVVVPNGTLFGDGIAARIKAQLLADFNLHTIVRLPEGVFSPYTDIPSNIIFFSADGPTTETWYYELSRPQGRRKYSKTLPISNEAFDECRLWWSERTENAHAWRVSTEAIVKRDEEGRVVSANLDIKNPHTGTQSDLRPPSSIVQSLIIKEREALALLGQIEALIHEQESLWSTVKRGPHRPMREVAPLVRRPVTPTSGTSYTEIGVRSFYKGVFHRRRLDGGEFTWQKLYAVNPGDLIFSNIMAWEQAIAVAGESENGCVGNHRMLTCEPDPAIMDSHFLFAYFQSIDGFRQILWASPGTIARNRTLNPDALMAINVPVPALTVQRGFRDLAQKCERYHAVLKPLQDEQMALRQSVLRQYFDDETLPQPQAHDAADPHDEQVEVVIEPAAVSRRPARRSRK